MTVHYNNNLDISCEYFTEEQFNNNVDMNGNSSVIHFNSRSLWKNINKIKELVHLFTEFNVIAVSETWLDDDKIADIHL